LPRAAPGDEIPSEFRYGAVQLEHIRF